MKLGQRVRVYRNLTRKSSEGAVYSVMDYKSRLVIGHVTEINLEFVTFKVSAAGKARAIRTKQRNVHAFIDGFICAGVPPKYSLKKRVGYYPFDSKGFRNLEGQGEVHSAQWVDISKNGVHAYWSY